MASSSSPLPESSAPPDASATPESSAAQESSTPPETTSDDFKINIKNPLDSPDKAPFQVSVERSSTVAQLKVRLQTEYPSHPLPRDQRLIYAGKLLSDEAIISTVVSSTVSPHPSVYTFHLVVVSETPPARTPNRAPTNSGNRPEAATQYPIAGPPPFQQAPIQNAQRIPNNPTIPMMPETAPMPQMDGGNWMAGMMPLPPGTILENAAQAMNAMNGGTARPVRNIMAHRGTRSAEDELRLTNAVQRVHATARMPPFDMLHTGTSSNALQLLQALAEQSGMLLELIYSISVPTQPCAERDQAWSLIDRMLQIYSTNVAVSSFVARNMADSGDLESYRRGRRTRLEERVREEVIREEIRQVHAMAADAMAADVRAMQGGADRPQRIQRHVIHHQQGGVQRPIIRGAGVQINIRLFNFPLMARLAFMVYFFSQDGSPFRTYALIFMAIVIYLWQTNTVINFFGRRVGGIVPDPQQMVNVMLGGGQPNLNQNQNQNMQQQQPVPQQEANTEQNRQGAERNGPQGSTGQQEQVGWFALMFSLAYSFVYGFLCSLVPAWRPQNVQRLHEVVNNVGNRDNNGQGDQDLGAQRGREGHEHED